MSTPAPAGGRTSVLARLRQPVGTPRRPRVVIGSVPQVSLLPKEIREAGSAAVKRRRLVGLVAVVAAASIAAVAAATAMNAGAASRLHDATVRTSELNGQIAKFSDIRDLEKRIALGEAAVAVGGATAIDWRQQIEDIVADMPQGYVVTSIAASGATPFEDYPQGTTPLEPRRAATVTMTIAAPSIGADFSAWLRLLRGIPAYADANATLSTNEDTTTVVLTVHLTGKAIVPADKTE
jgi:hypothetical protein